MSLNEILASGGALLLFLTLVQITPIKVNPWSAVGKIIGNGMRAIGKSMNKDVMDKLESVQKELKELGEKHNKLERRMDKDDADGCRTRILRFADELRRDVKHSEEFFNQILDDISDYERYCTDPLAFPVESASSGDATGTPGILSRHTEKGYLVSSYEGEMGLLWMWAGLSCFLSSGDRKSVV